MIAMLERAPFEALHGDEPTALALADFVDGANIRMIQRRSRLRLALKSLQRLRDPAPLRPAEISVRQIDAG